MNWRKIGIALSFLAGISVLSSCSTEWLKEENETNVTVDAIYNTPEGLSKASVGLYYLHRQLLRYGLNNDSEMFAGIVRGTDIEASQIGPLGAPAFAFYVQNELINYRYLQRYWDLYYGIIGKANEIIFYGELQDSKEFIAQRAIGEAKYFRAMSLLFLYERFNNLYLNTIPTTPENVNDKREYRAATKAEVFALITKDLDEAIEALPLTEMNEPGRITKGAARHVRMLAAMWMEDWNKAIEQGEAIAASGQYALLPLNQVFQQVNYINHKEAIASWQYFEGLGGSDYAGQFGFSGHRLKAIFTAESQRRNGNERVAINGGHGRGWIFPNPYLMSLYNRTTDNRYTAYYRHAYFYTNANAARAVNRNVGDTIVRTGVAAEDFRSLHVAIRKFEDVTTYTVTDSKGFGDVMQYRYAQTCITLAEAYLRAGNQAKALEWYNMTWERAGNPKRTTNITLEDIMEEHARELALEGHRWAFLKRIGRLESQVRLYAGEEGYNITARTNFQPRNVNWPIPTAQLNIFGESFPQNEGYPR